MMHWQQSAIVTLLLTLFGYPVLCQDLKPPTKSKTLTLPPCQACKTLVGSFLKGMERTSRGNFEGGNTNWEETRLGSYATSEVRFVEVQEKLCKEGVRGEDQCHFLADEHESVLEEWWKRQKEEPDLHKFLCIEKLKACCPVNHYGTNCDPCLGGPEYPCFGNGDCKGNGTRKGNGKCICHKGYKGELCNECASGYYESYKDEKNVLCSPCHKSCEGACSKAGPEGCEACKPGWRRHEDRCFDVDECLETTDNCNNNSFCVNTEGNHTCIECDKACDGCESDGPDMCKECAQGYKRNGELCIESTSRSRSFHASLTRYLTYFGLSVAACIIFQKNTMVAGMLGVCIAAYITASEYVVSQHSDQDDMRIVPHMLEA